MDWVSRSEPSWVKCKVKAHNSVAQRQPSRSDVNFRLRSEEVTGLKGEKCETTTIHYLN